MVISILILAVACIFLIVQNILLAQRNKTLRDCVNNSTRKLIHERNEFLNFIKKLEDENFELKQKGGDKLKPLANSKLSFFEANCVSEQEKMLLEIIKTNKHRSDCRPEVMLLENELCQLIHSRDNAKCRTSK